MKRSFWIFIFILSFCFPVFSQSLDDFSLDANTVSFDEATNKFDAEGSVEARHKNISLSTKHLVYDAKTKEIIVDKPFIMNRQGITFEGASLRYRLDTDSGLAKDVEIITSGVFVQGKELKVEGETFDFRNASFTTCDIEKGETFDAHYKVTASQIIFYPEVGWLVAYLGFFWIGNLPVMPIPTYIYDLKAPEKGRENVPPFPDIGTNDEDGTFIREKIIWNRNRHWNGYYALDYASKKGFGGGVWGNYLINQDRYGSVRLFGNPVDQWSGGFSYIYAFGEGISSLNWKTPYDLLGEAPLIRDFQAQFDLSIRERINYQKISYTPKIAWRGVKRNIFGVPRLNTDFEISGAQVKEESSFISLNEENFQNGYYYEIPLNDFGMFIPSLNGNWQWYSNDQAWQRIVYNLAYKKSLFNFDFSAYNLHYLANFGQSPFLFEKYRFVGQDEVGAGIFYNFFSSSLGLKASYYLPDMSVKDMDYIFSAGFHCYAIIINYRAMRKEFNFGFSLVDRK